MRDIRLPGRVNTPSRTGCPTGAIQNFQPEFFASTADMSIQVTHYNSWTSLSHLLTQEDGPEMLSFKVKKKATTQDILVEAC